MAVTVAPPISNARGAERNTSLSSSEPTASNIMNIATRKPKSPIRFMMNAFFPASALTFSEYQNPMRRYEQSPTPSHPTNITGKLEPSTSTSMKKTKRFRYEK